MSKQIVFEDFEGNLCAGILVAGGADLLSGALDSYYANYTDGWKCMEGDK